jgi:hypothetical protein
MRILSARRVAGAGGDDDDYDEYYSGNVGRPRGRRSLATS